MGRTVEHPSSRKSATRDDGAKLEADTIACPACGGTGWRKVFGRQTTEQHALHESATPIYLDCGVCEGLGEITEPQWRAYEERQS